MNMKNQEDHTTSTDRQLIGRKIVRTIDSILDTIMLSFFLIFLILGIYALWDTRQIYHEAESEQYESYKPTAEDSLSFEELKNINPDVFGWIQVYGTHIDYPILQTTDNDKYINTNVKGEYSLVGSIFLDYRNKQDFSDYNSILYGHHMDANAMFGEIGNFKDKEYFDSHKYGSIYCGGKEHGLEFFAFMEQDAYNFDIFTPAIEGQEAQQQYLQQLLKNSIHTREIGLTPNDHIVLLYTCTSNSTNGRHILIGRITDEVFENTFTDDSKKVLGLDGKKIWAFLNKIPLWCWIVIILVILLTLEILLRKMLEKRQRRKKKGEAEDEQDTST